MKKILVLGLSVVTVIVLSSCGGSGSSATSGQSAATAGAVAPVISSVMSGATSSINVDDVHVNTDLPEITFPCETSGNVATTGTYSVTGNVADNATLVVDTTSTFNACTGTDARCNIVYILGGSVTGTVNASLVGSNLTYSSTEQGTINVSGFATFDCPVDITVTITSSDLTGWGAHTSVDDVLAKMTGTICGKTVAEIKTLYDSSDTVYCAGVQALATTTEAL